MVLLRDDVGQTASRREALVGGRRRDQWIMAATTMLPAAVWLALFILFPLVFALWISLHKWNPLFLEKSFVGLANYARALRDPIFRISALNTFYYAIVYVPLDIGIALTLALMINASGRSKSLFRTTHFIPVVTSAVAVSLVWTTLYQPTFGVFNALLQALHLPRQRWLLSTTQVMPSIILYSLWKHVGYNMVIFLAGLAGIDRTFYDAAMVDGANKWQILRKITLPLLRSTFIFVIVSGVIGALQVFNTIYVLTAPDYGGPVHASRVLVLYVYQIAFEDLWHGYASAMAILLFLLIVLITLVQLRVLRMRWEY